jgi:hypothetical protein
MVVLVPWKPVARAALVCHETFNWYAQALFVAVASTWLIRDRASSACCYTIPSIRSIP